MALSNMAFMGGMANDPVKARDLLPEFQKANMKIPGSIAFTTQAGIFQSVQDGRSIDVEITGPDLENLIQIGTQVFFKVMEKIPGGQARPIPSLDLGNPELQVLPLRRRAAELGISNDELGYAISALVDGAKASDYHHEGQEIDLKIIGQPHFAHSTHLLEQMPIATPGGELVALGSVANVVQGKRTRPKFRESSVSGQSPFALRHPQPWLCKPR